MKARGEMGSCGGLAGGFMSMSHTASGERPNEYGPGNRGTGIVIAEVNV
ncbi:MAG: hypothetical protein WD208_11715 [Dehalococcoidia bacterium]